MFFFNLNTLPIHQCLFYAFIKILARCCLLLFCRRKLVSGTALKKLEGPAIIASNHPNSMMDAILIACQCKQPVHFTIRSDMFKNPLFRFLLQHLNGVPVYRASEAKEQLRENFATFSKCRDILLNNGIIIIFSEGVTLHDWKLKPFKSGTARLVHYALEEPTLQQKLQVAAVGLTYSDYQYIGKTVIIQSAPVFKPVQRVISTSDGEWKKEFNETLYQHLRPLVVDMEAEQKDQQKLWQFYLQNCEGKIIRNKAGNPLQEIAHHIEGYQPGPGLFDKHHRYDYTNKGSIRGVIFTFLLLTIPGMAGWVLNACYYYPLMKWCRKKTKGTIFFDSLAFGICIVTYPMYILLFLVLLPIISSVPYLAWVIILPVTGFCTTAWLRNARQIINYYQMNSTAKKILEDLLN